MLKLSMYLYHILIAASTVTLLYALRTRIKNYFARFTPDKQSGPTSVQDRDLTLIACGMAGLVATSLIVIGLPFIVGIVGAMITAFVTPLVLKSRRTARYRTEFDAQLAESLETVGASLRAGLTLKDSLKVSVKTCQPAFAYEIQHALSQYHFGVPLEEALDGIRQRVGTASCNIAIGSMILSSRIGGRLPEMLQKITGTIKERQRVEGKLQSLTAQGRAQAALLVSAPPLLGIGMYFYDPSKMALLTNNLIGQILLITAIVLEVLGIAITAKVMKLEV